MNSKYFTFNTLLAIVSLLVVSFFSSCTKSEEVAPEPLLAQTVSNLLADPVTIDPNTGRASGGTNRFTFFSFKENKIISNADSATNKWDIGFRGTTIIINGGAIRTGQGGAYIHTGIFEDLKEIPTSATFAQDNALTNLAIPTTSGMGWYNYNPMTMLISPIPGRVLVIRTGDGKFAKVEILSYYKDAPPPATITLATPARHYTFRYVYQGDGSKRLN
ncbi:MAG: HmuY family protein [Thermoflexibacter sp.]|nr:HmuY family protein [Thermoflexibacter sp.]